jgi:hypothetical protein
MLLYVSESEGLYKHVYTKVRWSKIYISWKNKDDVPRDGILERGFESRFLGILLILEFLSGCPLIFPFYKMLFMKRHEFSFMFSE